MKRDFSTSAEEVILGYVDVKETQGEGVYCITFEYSDIERYEYYSDDIEYHMNNIKLHHQYLVERNGYTKEVIQDIFANVRALDVEYAEGTIYADKNTTFEPYRKTMQALLDSIRVSAPGESLSKVDYLQNARMQYGQYGCLSDSYGSIFASTEVFNNKMKHAGNGLLGATYEALQEDVALEGLMNKGIDEIKPWEVVALSMVFDDCVTIDSNNNYQVDYERLSALLDKSYIQTAYRAPISQHDVMLSGYATYEIAPIMDLLALYRENETNQQIGLYMNPDARVEHELSFSQMKADSYVTDTIFAVNEYYSKISLDSWDDSNYSQLHMEIDNSQEGKIVVAITNYDEEKRSNITIYGFTEDLLEETNTANVAGEISTLIDTEGEVLTTVAITGSEHTVGAIAGLLPGGGTVMELYDGAKDIYDGAKDIYEIWDTYYSSATYNTECNAKIQGLQLQGIANTLNCSGSVVQYEDYISVRHLAMDQRETTIDVVLYNEFHPEDRIELEQLEQEFVSILTGEQNVEDCSGIQALKGFDRADEYDAQEHPVGIYDDSIGSYVQDKYGLENKYQATLAQLEEAAKYAAEEWRQDVEEN